MMDIVVDAYDAGERVMWWHCYLDDAMKPPFNARMIAKHPISPLDKGEEVKVLGIAPAKVCLSGMFAAIR
jgi:hypothetical protein